MLEPWQIATRLIGLVLTLNLLIAMVIYITWEFSRWGKPMKVWPTFAFLILGLLFLGMMSM